MFYKLIFLIICTVGITFAANVVTSDEFSTSLNTGVWTSTNNANETISVSNGELIMSLASGTNNDAFVGGNNSVRIMQNIGGSDFYVETKIDTLSSLQFLGAGIMVIQDSTHYVRFEVGSDSGPGGNVHISLNYVVSGAQTQVFETTGFAPPSVMYLRFKKSGNTYTATYSTDGTNYTTLGTSSSIPISSNNIGLYAYNFNSTQSNSPAYTAKFDYFRAILTSDHFFNDSSLSSIWQEMDAPGGGTMSFGSGTLTLSIPSNNPHDGWTSGNNGLVAIQAAPNLDFTITTKLTSSPLTGQGQGLEAIQDFTHFARCEVDNFGSGVVTWSGYVNGSTGTAVDQGTALGSSSFYWIQMKRSGNTFTCLTSSDGTNFTQKSQFVYAMNVIQVGIALNTSGSTAQTVTSTDFIVGDISSGGGGGGTGPIANQCENGNTNPPSSFTVPAGAIHTGSFGAVGNGTTDDTTHLQNAINALTSGGTLVFDPGTYKISASLNLKALDNITYLVSNPGTVQINIPETVIHSIFLTTSPHNFQTIEGFIFDGGGIGVFDGSKTNPPTNWIIRGNTFQNMFGSSGSNLQNVAIGSDTGFKNSSIDHNTFKHLISNNTTRANCNGQTNYPDCSNGGGIKIYGADNLTVSNNTFDHVFEAMYLCFQNGYTTSGLQFLNNHFTNIHRMGLEMQGPHGCGGSYSQNPQGLLETGITVSNNLFTDPWDPYWNTFFVSASLPVEYYNFSTNQVCGSLGSGCIQIGGKNITVKNNQIHGNDSNNALMSLAVELAGENALATGNYIIQGKMQAGIQLSYDLNGKANFNYICNSLGSTGVPFHNEQDNPNSLTNGDPNTGINAIKWNETWSNNTISTTCPANLANVALNTPTVSNNIVSATATLGGILTSNQIFQTDFYVDGSINSFATDQTTPYNLSKSTSSLSNGNHTLTATATDLWCSPYSSSSQPFTVTNSTPPPSITNPFSIFGNVQIRGTVSFGHQ